jgi:hypothetical protein
MKLLPKLRPSPAAGPYHDTASGSNASTGVLAS